MNTTVRMKASDLSKDWHVIDAAGRPLGRVATEAATLLRGKHKPTYEPHLDGGDYVIIVNARKVRVSGNKANTMVYYRHSGYPGGLKSRTFEEQMDRFPDKILERAIHGMLPKGSLGLQIRKHLKVYAGPNHPHEAQVTGSDKARARRDEAAANGQYLRRVIPGFRPSPAPELEPDEEPEVEAPVARRSTRTAPAEATPTPVAAAPEPEATADEETPEQDAAVAADAPAADAPPRRRRARKTETTEDSGE